MRRLTVVLAIGAMALATAMPVAAVKPIRGCPNEGFVPMDYTTFRNLSISVGVPLELLGPEHLAGWNVYDRNDDGMLCVKDLPDTPGTLDGWIFNVVDNTSNH